MQQSLNPIASLTTTTSTSMRATGSPTVISTPALYMEQLTRDTSNDLIPNDQYVFIQRFPDSTEADVSVIKSCTTSKIFVVKHTQARILHDDHGRQVYDLPHEQIILRDVLKPHENIIKILDYSTSPYQPGRYRYVLEYCSGGDLADAICWRTKRNNSFPEQFVLHVFVEMAAALSFLHHGLRRRDDGQYYQDNNHIAVVHGDIKLENIFLRWTDDNIGGMPQIVLGDFGAAKRADAKESTVGPGTADYHSPEDLAIRGNAAYSWENRHLFRKMVNSRTTACDVYALGHIMFMLAARQRDPWPIGRNPADLWIAQDYSTPGLKEMIASCLEIDPRKRAKMSFESDNSIGFLDRISELQRARNTLIEQKGAISRFDWDPSGRPPPMWT